MFIPDWTNFSCRAKAYSLKLIPNIFEAASENFGGNLWYRIAINAYISVISISGKLFPSYFGSIAYYMAS